MSEIIVLVFVKCVHFNKYNARIENPMEYTAMDARAFFKKFKTETNKDRWIKEKGKTLFEIYKVDAEFTPVVTKIINDIIDSAGYIHQNEYFRIDAVGWISRYMDMEKDAALKGIRLNPHLWDLKIAVEHENSKEDWTDEIIKLVHVKCPLKVVIAYNYNDERGEMEQKKLSFVAKWMQSVDAFQTGTGEEYLIVIGNGCNHITKESDYNDFGYVGYLYDRNEKKFLRID